MADITEIEDRFKDRHSKKQKPEKKYKLALHEIKALQKESIVLNRQIATGDLLLKCLLSQLEGLAHISDEEMKIAVKENHHIDIQKNLKGDKLVLTLVKNYKQKNKT